MLRYYTRACNFYYGSTSKALVKKKSSIPLNGNSLISFDQIEIISRKSKKKIFLNKLANLPKSQRKKVLLDLKKISSKKKNFANLNFSKLPNIMGVLNLTPDSFSDGGKFNSFKKALKRIKEMKNAGADIIDIGGESTRPGSKIIPDEEELNRVKEIIEKFKKKFPKTLLSIDTRKSLVMDFSIKKKTDLINDVSCFRHDPKSHYTIKNKNLWKIIHHMQGTPQTMQKNPSYDHVLLDIYDFFEEEIKNFKSDRFSKKLILDPGIGFGKNLKHNLMILNKVSIFHSLGFPILLGTSRKRFINQISGNYDTRERIGGTLSSINYSFLQGIKIFRVHNVEETKQGLLVFETLLNK